MHVAVPYSKSADRRQIPGGFLGMTSNRAASTRSVPVLSRHQKPIDAKTWGHDGRARVPRELELRRALRFFETGERGPNRVAGRPTSTRIAGRECGSGISRPLALTDGGLPRAAATVAAAAHRRQPKTSFPRRRATATNESGSRRGPTNVLALASVSTSVCGPSSTVRCTCETGSQY